MGAYDAVTAKLAEECGAPAVFVSGFVACGVEAGEPDMGALSQTQMFEHIRRRRALPACISKIRPCPRNAAISPAGSWCRSK